MKNKSLLHKLTGALLALALASCAVPNNMVPRQEHRDVPTGYPEEKDTVSVARTPWRAFFTDPYLVALIDTALQRNQELNILLQEINIARNEVKARKGEYLPFIGLQGGAGIEKAARYTRAGAVDESTEIEPGKNIPDPLPDFMLAATASWQVDVWKKLRNARKSAVYRYLGTTEGRNFAITQLISEIARSYYELMALDNQMTILEQYIAIQLDALEIVKLQKQAAKVTELAVRRFEAEVYKNQSRLYYINQQITVTENRLNFLVGRFPQRVRRSGKVLTDIEPTAITAGVPSQLLQNRPDIRQAELELAASKIDVAVARANFYPNVTITAALGYEAFNASYIIRRPESMLYSLAGGVAAPLINRNAIKAMYYSANARQIQAVFGYERSVLNAYTEVANQLSNINNLDASYDFRSRQVAALTESIEVSTRLFKSARADYMEVLLTQRDALESKFELVETRKQQLNAMVNVYQVLGGGWR